MAKHNHVCLAMLEIWQKERAKYQKTIEKLMAYLEEDLQDEEFK